MHGQLPVGAARGTVCERTSTLGERVGLCGWLRRSAMQRRRQRQRTGNSLRELPVARRADASLLKSNALVCVGGFRSSRHFLQFGATRKHVPAQRQLGNETHRIARRRTDGRRRAPPVSENSRQTVCSTLGSRSARCSERLLTWASPTPARNHRRSYHKELHPSCHVQQQGRRRRRRGTAGQRRAARPGRSVRIRRRPGRRRQGQHQRQACLQGHELV